MDKNAIKKFAVWARTELIARVSLKSVEYGITEGNIEEANVDSVGGKVLTADEKKQRQALIAEINDKGYKQVMEEVAYTWFNRFSALRFMEVNGYLPSHVRVFTDEENNFKPQIIAEAIHLDLDGLDMEKVYELKDAEKTEELYKYLLIVQCNALNKILPGMFQKIADYTELLLPDNLLREGSVIQQMIELIPEDDWKDAVQIIGWLYQYYNSEKKDDVFAALKKNVKITKENIPAATQLFTPDWIVRYMVENSLGRLWLEGHPDVKSQLLPTEEEQSAYAAGNRDPEDTKWHYYLEEAEQEPEVQAQLEEIRMEYAALTPDQLKVIDPCSGSGHILAYLFDVLMKIYESYGYTTREAVASIVENNLYGLDIDDRAAQLAYFAVMMKARRYDRRFFSRGIQPHVYAIVESNHVDSFALEYFCDGDAKLKAAMDTIISELHDAKEYGSILTVTQQDWSALYDRFAEITEDINMFRDTVLRELLPLVQVAEALAHKYDVVVTNPPYMASNGMSDILLSYIKKHYGETKQDLYAVFIDKCINLGTQYAKIGLMTSYTWMFLSSFENARKKWLEKNSIHSLIQPEYHAFFESAYVPICTFVFLKNFYNYTGTYTIAEAFEQWQAECDERFNQLKANEEELNRIFIDIYGLQEELTPEVEDKDITVRKADLGREIRSFISYAVGCMFGRYSLDVDGLAYAGGEWDASKYASFAADKDNIIPICDDEYFEDDIVGLFVKFVKTVYGADTLDENLKFIADALGGKGQPKDVIRNYFLSDFYSDHCKIYQKRPIYWLFDSGKKNGFKALIYMHRYQPDTIARIRTDYVHEQQARYRTAIADLEQRIANASTGERVKLNKKLTTLQAQDTEIRTYEEKIHHLADQMISIDLDDGVKKNYAIFQDVLAKIK
jgi:hypothetical protein